MDVIISIQFWVMHIVGGGPWGLRVSQPEQKKLHKDFAVCHQLLYFESTDISTMGTMDSSFVWSGEEDI